MGFFERIDTILNWTGEVLLAGTELPGGDGGARRGWGGAGVGMEGWGWRWGGGGGLGSLLTLHCHHQNDSCIISWAAMRCH